jgi:hypothetical protein
MTMMKWYVIMKEDVDLDSLGRRLAAFGCRCETERLKPVVLGSNEQVVEVDGPEDLAQKIDDDDADIVSVCPEIAFD